MVRAKFQVTNKTGEREGTISLSPVYTGSLENEAFFKLTPSGSITLSTVNPSAFEQFEVGKEYYVDFIPAS